MSVDAIGRLQAIRHRLDADGRVRVTELAESLGVSEMTIRRDLDTLAEEGVARRVRGGALAAGPQQFAERFGQHGRSKERIAAKLQAMVGQGGAIGLDASTTMQRLAGTMSAMREVAVLTNGLDGFQAMQGRPGISPLLTGGRLDARTGSLVGALAVRSVRELNLRRLFVSAAALDDQLGSSESTIEEAEVKLAFAEVSAHVVLAVDSSKLGQRAVSRCLPVDALDALVTELDPTDPLLEPYRGRLELI